jgi:ketosteroid isomerase-like protein
MAAVSEQQGEKEISALLRALNEAWVGGRFDDVGACYHPDAVIQGPTLEPLSRGRQACVKSYEDFVRQSVVREFTMPDPRVNLWGSTAVATCKWEIAYQMKGQDFRESGHDVYVLSHEDGRWLVVWRLVLPSPRP